MKQILSLLIVFCSLNLMGQDTFSIIAVDPDTGDIGSAGASCINLSNVDWDQWITDIIPVVAANFQAYVHSKREPGQCHGAHVLRG